MYRPGTYNRAPAPAPVAAAKPPIMKYRQASKIADKNARTIVKIQQLLEITQLPGYKKSDPDGHVTIRIEQLKKRLNRRLAKIAKWVDCPVEDRQIEFRHIRSIPTMATTGSYGFRTGMPPNVGMGGRLPGQPPMYMHTSAAPHYNPAAAAAYLAEQRSQFVRTATAPSSSVGQVQPTQTNSAQYSATVVRAATEPAVSSAVAPVAPVAPVATAESTEVLPPPQEALTEPAPVPAAPVTDAVANNIDVRVMSTNEPSLAESFSVAAIEAPTAVEAPPVSAPTEHPTAPSV